MQLKQGVGGETTSPLLASFGPVPQTPRDSNSGSSRQVSSGVSNNKSIMDGMDNVFTPGSVITCVTCFNKRLEGEVVAFDYDKRVLVIKSPSSSKPTNSDVYLLNLELVSDVQIKKVVKSENISNSIPHINVQKLDERCREACSERKSLAAAFSAGVSEEGIKLFLSLTKTLGSTGRVNWRQKDILYENKVLIRAPNYREEDCVSQNASKPQGAPKELDYVKQLVRKYWADVNKSNKNMNSGGSSGGSTASSSSSLATVASATGSASASATTSGDVPQKQQQGSPPTVQTKSANGAPHPPKSIASSGGKGGGGQNRKQQASVNNKNGQQNSGS